MFANVGQIQPPLSKGEGPLAVEGLLTAGGAFFERPCADFAGDS